MVGFQNVIIFSTGTSFYQPVDIRSHDSIFGAMGFSTTCVCNFLQVTMNIYHLQSIWQNIRILLLARYPPWTEGTRTNALWRHADNMWYHWMTCKIVGMFCCAVCAVCVCVCVCGEWVCVVCVCVCGVCRDDIFHVLIRFNSNWVR